MGSILELLDIHKHRTRAIRSYNENNLSLFKRMMMVNMKVAMQSYADSEEKSPLQTPV